MFENINGKGEISKVIR